MTTKITLPDTAEGLLELTTDKAKFAQAIEDHGKEEVFGKIAALQSARNDKGGAVTENIEEQRQVAAGELARKMGAPTDEVVALSGQAAPVAKGKKFKFTKRGARYNEDGPAAELDNLFENSADFISTITPPEFQDRKTRSDLAVKLGKMNDILAAYSEQVPSGGGFLLPETLRNQLEMIALEQSIIAPRAQVLPMQSLTMSVPIVDDTII